MFGGSCVRMADFLTQDVSNEEFLLRLHLGEMRLYICDKGTQLPHIPPILASPPILAPL